MIQAPTLRRDLLAEAFGGNERLIRAFEDQAEAVEQTQQTVESSLTATGAIQDATVLTLSPNDAFTNERILTLGDGLKATDNGERYTVKLNKVARTENYSVTFIALGNSTLAVPVMGTLATTDQEETLEEKTLDAPKMSGLVNALDDAAAAGAGVPVGGVYRNGSVLMVRVS